LAKRNGLSRLWINLAVEAAIKEVYAFSSFLLFGSRASANPINKKKTNYF
jgi:hypothetical protein